MYALVGTRAPQADSAVKGADTPEKALAWVKGLAPTYLQLGGGQTLGRGIVRLRWAGKAPARPAARRKSKKS
jgi:CRISPR/Cas system CMR subunit Cmr4 (Cas7 group RAMP superfamily)